jgi:hypothetical protein
MIKYLAIIFTLFLCHTHTHYSAAANELEPIVRQLKTETISSLEAFLISQQAKHLPIEQQQLLHELVMALINDASLQEQRANTLGKRFMWASALIAGVSATTTLLSVGQIVRAMISAFSEKNDAATNQTAQLINDTVKAITWDLIFNLSVFSCTSVAPACLLVGLYQKHKARNALKAKMALAELLARLKRHAQQG